jgi:hypothetical protein
VTGTIQAERAIPPPFSWAPIPIVAASGDRSRRPLDIAKDRLAQELMGELPWRAGRGSHCVGHPYFIPTTGHHRVDWAPSRAEKSQVSGLGVTRRTIWENTQIYEGTNQIQRVVIAKRLLG